MDIDKTLWSECKICDKTKKEICSTYGGDGIYYCQAFKEHLKIEHELSLEGYFTKYVDRPICKCGICKQLCDISCNKGTIYWKDYKCGRYEGLLKWSEQAKIDRKGKNNPMFGVPAWNKGRTKENCKTMKRISEINTGKIMSEESKAKMSESAKKRTVHGHTGHKHSEECKQKNRENTLKRIKEGKFKQTKTKPHLQIEQLLIDLNINFESEKILGYWSFDIYLIDLDIFIEVDGDYFHSNPKIYPNGPKTKTQKINHARDIAKNNYCIKNNLVLLRFWESDILNNIDKIKEEICSLRKL